jgi:hypothetical protein
LAVNGIKNLIHRFKENLALFNDESGNSVSKILEFLCIGMKKEDPDQEGYKGLSDWIRTTERFLNINRLPHLTVPGLFFVFVEAQLTVPGNHHNLHYLTEK